MAVLSASQRAIVQWVIDYMETGGAGDGHIDQTASDQLARVFRNMCGFTCGCPGSFQEGLDDTPYTTLLRVLLCLSEQTGASVADLAIIQWVIDYMERGGSGHGHFDQKASDELARVFRDSCGFMCGCPGTFQTGLLQSPVTTLLRAILCADEGAVGIGTEGGESGSLLLAACGFGILAATTITNTGATIVDGDLGLSPGTSVTGFPPGLVLGEMHVIDVEAANAQLALTAAYLDLEGRGGSTPVAGDLGGQTLTPGPRSGTISFFSISKLSAREPLRRHGNKFMKIVNGNAEIDPAELAGLSSEELSALVRKADVTRITVAEYFQGVVTDAIQAAVSENLDLKLASERVVSEAFVRADRAVQDQIKNLLGVAVTAEALFTEVK